MQTTATQQIRDRIMADTHLISTACVALNETGSMVDKWRACVKFMGARGLAYTPEQIDRACLVLRRSPQFGTDARLV